MKIIFKYYSSPHNDTSAAISDCQQHLDTLRSNNETLAPLHTVFFIPAVKPEDYLEAKNALYSAFQDRIHQFSCIGQAPCNSGLAMEISLADTSDPDISVLRKRAGNMPYTLISTEGEKRVYISGACGNISDAIEDQAVTAFKKVEAVLESEDMDFSHVFRQWNYIERITDFDPASKGKKQHYQIFNDVRSLYYAKSDFKDGYPAATGIGMGSGGIILDIIASVGSSVNHTPVANPQQLDAHRYTQNVLVGDALQKETGRTTPKFERAKLVTGDLGKTLYISGTAAIKGEDTIPSDDIDLQTRITLENISKLHINGSREHPYRHMRAYVKDPAKTPVVKNICSDFFGSIPMVFLKADVCRDNLIVEIEAEIDLKN